MFNSFDRRRPVYTISIAAEILDCHPRTLRIYEAQGLVHPQRKNHIRYYSEDDIETLREICRLMEEWDLNLAGVKALLGVAQKFHIRAKSLIEKMLE